MSIIDFAKDFIKVKLYPYPLSYEPFQDSEHKLFFGKAMLILRTKEGQTGDISTIAESDGLAPAGIVVQSR
jgi:hypothetical protein